MAWRMFLVVVGTITSVPGMIIIALLAAVLGAGVRWISLTLWAVLLWVAGLVVRLEAGLEARRR